MMVRDGHSDNSSVYSCLLSALEQQGKADEGLQRMQVALCRAVSSGAGRSPAHLQAPAQLQQGHGSPSRRHAHCTAGSSKCRKGADVLRALCLTLAQQLCNCWPVGWPVVAASQHSAAAGLGDDIAAAQAEAYTSDATRVNLLQVTAVVDGCSEARLTFGQPVVGSHLCSQHEAGEACNGELDGMNCSTIKYPDSADTHLQLNSQASRPSALRLPVLAPCSIAKSAI